MKRAVHTLSTVIALTWAWGSTAIAQAAPSVDRLTPLQRQQISRDLVPSSAQDFFRTGQANLEQEIHWLTRPRSSNETLLKVSQGAQGQPEAQTEKPIQWHNDRTK